jgi:hypothetical protein
MLSVEVLDELVMVLSLRRCLHQLEVSANCSLQLCSIENSEDCIAELKEEVDHLKLFVKPLRTYLGATHNVGKVAAVKKMLADYTPPEAPRAPRTPRKSAPSNRQSLRNSIRSYFEKSLFDGNSRPFLPEGVIDTLVVPEAVKKELQITDPNREEQALIDYIVSGSKKLFLITIQAGIRPEHMYHAMVLFMTNNINDKSLPITLNERFWALQGAREFPEFDIETAKSKLDEIDPDGEVWERWSREEFYQAQWAYLAPVFSTRDVNIDLDPQAILPFLSKNPDIRTGAFGQVFQVKIHSKHLIDPDNLVCLPNQSAH